MYSRNTFLGEGGREGGREDGRKGCERMLLSSVIVVSPRHNLQEGMERWREEGREGGREGAI